MCFSNRMDANSVPHLEVSSFAASQVGILALYLGLVPYNIVPLFEYSKNIRSGILKMLGAKNRGTVSIPEPENVFLISFSSALCRRGETYLVTMAKSMSLPVIFPLWKKIVASLCAMGPVTPKDAA